VRSRRPTWLIVALTGAGAFLAGVLLVAILGGAKGVIRDKTVTRTVTGVVTNGGTVIVKAEVPPVVGERLDVAIERLDRAGFDHDVDGGGILGVVVESNWEVSEQDPAPGERLEQGSSVTLKIERR
jgi:PASTA domain